MRFYVVPHSNQEYSVQSRQGGGGVLLQVKFDPKSRREAENARDAANFALSVAGVLTDPQP